jgi:multidrug transporter EmrE-like cation transporter
MALAQLLFAATAFALGGLFMKLSAGLTHGGATAAFVALFVTGAIVQALGMQRADLGPSYIFVLGVEALLTVLLSAFYLHESYSASRLAAILLVVIGIAWLRQT